MTERTQCKYVARSSLIATLTLLTMILCDENKGTTLGETGNILLSLTISFPLKMKLIHV
jgi:hypothetical protein